MKPILFLAACLLITSCADTEDSNTKFLDSLKGSSFEFKVDKISTSPNVQSPGDILTNDDYIEYSGDRRYTILFSDDGESVLIEPGTITGFKKSLVENKQMFELVDGVFSSGRFMVWIENGIYLSELTIYGSGVPILLSERGKLVPE